MNNGIREDGLLKIIWEAKNGATRNHLKIISEITTCPTSKPLFSTRAQLNFFIKNNSAFIIVANGTTDNTPCANVGIFMVGRGGYGYKVKTGAELFTASSIGGPGNSESKFGIYLPGTIIAVNSFNNRDGEQYYALSTTGWQYLGKDVLVGDEQAQEVPHAAY